MVFTRRLTRGLSDGEKIIVERAWKIRFVRSNGFTVSGSQISVDVRAPEALAALKRMEEAKIEKGLFPIRLRSDGIIDGSRSPSHQQAVQQAIDHAQRRVAGLGTGAAAHDARRFLNAIQQATGEHISRMPRDLFFPRQLQASETREISLPDGSTGSVKVSFNAEMSRQFGVFRQARRAVTTTLGKVSRKSAVEWSLAPVRQTPS